MEKRQIGLIATIVTALLCGCPGLFNICWGGLAAFISFIPDADINIGGSSDPQAALFAGIASLCGGIVFLAIPIVIGVLTLRTEPEEAAVISNEPLPPAS